MAFKPLESTFVYRHLNADGIIGRKIVNILNNGQILQKSNIEEQIFIITKNFKFPLKYTILEEFNKGDIVLIHSPSTTKMLTTFPFFLTRDKNDKVIAVVITDIYGTLKEDRLSIDVKKLYTMMEGAYFAKLCYYYPKQIASISSVISGSAVYANIITRVFNKKYALNLDRNKLNKMIFLASKFYLLNLLGLSDNEMSDKYAMKNCRDANIIALQETNSIFNPAAFTDISTFILELQKPELGFKFKDLQVRNFLETFIQAYDGTMLMSLESFAYFFYNILAVSNGAYVNNQYILEDIVGTTAAKMYVDMKDIGT